MSRLHADLRNGFLYHIIICDVLHIFAFGILAAALFTASISSRVPRTMAWFLLISSATLGTGSRILVVGQQIGSDPNRVVCIVQAMLLSGTAILNIYTGAAFVLQLYFTLLAVKRSRELPSIWRLLMQIVPVFIFLGTLLAVLVVRNSYPRNELYLKRSTKIGSLQPSLIRRSSSGMYCELAASSLNYSLTAVGLVGVLITVTTKVLILIELWATKRTLTTEHLPKITRTPPGTVGRAFGYTFILFVIFILGVASFFPRDENLLAKITDIVIAVGAAVTAVVFATESDIMKVWLFWRKSRDLNTAEDVQGQV
ncbi:hypothetical protein CVT25_007304 [Psilocybe cyanescens]|uniref:G-protein coupled receptors family 1 profile domain-containing protein n=1 Tax=Psilocybe cyanescens TaxID=93625 RepID=A0A409XPB1_PSICY|nr:hypothetical protein CVT25_007304 [Psilocybe cyanescens]